MADEKARTYYMAVALLSAKRSKAKEQQNQAGACIVNEEEERIVSIGYNGMPLNCRDDLMPWTERNDDKGDLISLYVAHAEMNAIVSMTPRSVAGCTIYTTMHPCVECVKMLIRSGIKKVVCPKAQSETDEKKLLDNLSRQKKIEVLIFEVAPNVLGKDDTFKVDFGRSYGGVDGGKEGTRKQTVEDTERLSAPISWEQYFMGMAIIARDMMSHVNKKEGACIVNEDKRIVGIGYLCLYDKGGENCDGQFDVVLHSPVGAIVNKTLVSVRDCTLYMTCNPCNECAKVIVQAGLKAVIYLENPTEPPKASSDVNKSTESCADTHSDKDKMEAAKRMLNLGKIRCDPYEYEKSEIILKFPPTQQGATKTPRSSSVTEEDQVQAGPAGDG